MPNNAFLMVIGPREAEIAISTLNCIKSLFPSCDIYILDDNTAVDNYNKICNWKSRDCEVILRNQDSNGYIGIGKSVFKVLKHIVETGKTYDFVTKIDPDAIILQSNYCDYIEDLFKENGPGIIGPYKISANGSPRKNSFVIKRVLMDLLPVGLNADKKTFRFGWPFYIKYLLLAMIKGYKVGDHVLGGIMVIHGETLELLYKCGYLKAMKDGYKAMLFGEDHLLPIGTQYVGHKLIEMNPLNKGKIWSQAQPPIPLSAYEILRRKIIAIHPIKNDEPGNKLRNILTEAVLNKMDVEN